MSIIQEDLFGGRAADFSDDAERDPLDRYYTPAALADACMAVVGLSPGHTFWDPSTGGGAFLTAAHAYTDGLFASDLDPAAAGLSRSYAVGSEVADFEAVTPHDLKWPAMDWVGGNGPYGSAPKRWIDRSLDLSIIGGFWLTRAAVRHRISAAAEKALHLCGHVYPRPPFGGPAMAGKKKGTDASEYVFMVFRHDQKGPAISRKLVWR